MNDKLVLNETILRQFLASLPAKPTHDVRQTVEILVKIAPEVRQQLPRSFRR